MAVLTDEYGPYNEGPGASVGEAQWGRIYESLSSSGVSPRVLGEMRVSQRAAGANMSVDVAPGQVFLQGHQGRSAGVTNLPIGANASGVTRYDRVIARSNRATNVTELDVKQGAGGVLATLQQDDTIYESHIAQVTVPNGATSITNAGILFKPSWASGRASSPTCQASGSSFLNPSIPHGINTVFVFDQPSYDTGPYWDPAHPTRLTAPVTGLYLVGSRIQIYEGGDTASGHANLANIAKGVRSLTITVGGGTSLESPQYWWWGTTPVAAGGGAPYGGLVPDARMVGAVGIMGLAAGSYLELSCFQISGGPMNINTVTLFASYLGALG